MPESWTTDPQAEVLYPGQIGLDRLRAVYVRDDENISYVRSLFGVFNQDRLPAISPA